MRYLEELERVDPEMFKLEVADRDLEYRTLWLARMYRSASGDERDRYKQDLAESVQKHFNVRQSRRELHIKRLREELEQLERAIQRRMEMRKEIVDRRVSELIGESDLEF